MNANTPTRGHRPKTWTIQDIPDQKGRVAIITGANAGTGFEAAQVLAGRGATVVLACRSRDKALGAKYRILATHPQAQVEVEDLDLSSLASIQAATRSIRARHTRLDLLINNAGVMIPPQSITQDGFELQFGTNHLGHFAWTSSLLELLLATPSSRIITMSSMAHKQGRIRFDDLHFEKGYKAWGAYAQSKLANLMFTYELQRRLEKAKARSGSSTVAVAAHPGWARTELQRHVLGGSGTPQRLTQRLARVLARPFEALFSQDALGGALPLLRAAVDPEVHGGEYFGPSGCLELKGAPIQVPSTPEAKDMAVQQRLWQVSEHLTGTRYAI